MPKHPQVPKRQNFGQGSAFVPDFQEGAIMSSLNDRSSAVSESAASLNNENLRLASTEICDV